MFQNLRENQQIYVLTKGPVPSLDMGTVIKIQGPVPSFQAGSNMMGYTMDITVAVNGINRPFPQLPVNKDSAEYVNEQTIIAMSRDAMNAELNSLKNESVNAIQRGREEEARLPVWDKLILQLNPEVAEKQRQEQEIATLKSQVAQLAQTNTNLESMMARLMDKLDGDANKSPKNK
jgi:hypothetical protein